MAEFRTTPGGSLEVLHDGVWTHVPDAAAASLRAEVEKLRAALNAADYYINRLETRWNDGNRVRDMGEAESAYRTRRDIAWSTVEQSARSIDAGNTLTKAQEEMRSRDPRPSEEIIREQRGDWQDAEREQSHDKQGGVNAGICSEDACGTSRDVERGSQKRGRGAQKD